MRYILICELIAVSVVLPFLIGMSHRRGALSEKQMAFAIATLLSLFMGTAVLYIESPENLFSLTLKDWLFAVGVALFCWFFLYPISRWLYKQFFQK
jgi:hypothetical protein